jgi:hypothetical protein
MKTNLQSKLSFFSMGVLFIILLAFLSSGLLTGQPKIGIVTPVVAYESQQINLAMHENGESRWISFLKEKSVTKDTSDGMRRISYVEVISSTAKNLSLAVSLPGMSISSLLMKDGQQYSSLDVPGSGQFHIGKPDVPIFGQWILIPNGTSLHMRIEPGEAIFFDNVDLPPVQPPQVNSPYAGKLPFTKDGITYSTDADFPGIFAEVEPIQKMRGQECTILWIYPYQYNPVTRRLGIYTNLSVELEFDGQIQPILSCLKSDAFETMLRRLGVNAEAVFSAEAEVDKDVVGNEFNETLLENKPFEAENSGQIDCDYLIVCPPDFNDAANTLASWKRKKGFRTEVFNSTVADPNTTRINIQEKVKDLLPEYLLLLGDAEFIPCYYEVTHAVDQYKIGLMQGKVASDSYYAILDNDDLTDLFVGRLPVDTASEAQTAVDQIINYEQTTPDTIIEPNYYSTAALVAHFQDDDSNGVEDWRFVKTSEDIYQYLMNSTECDYNCLRIYSADPDVNPTYWSENPLLIFENDVNGGLPLPEELLYPFQWDGDTADIFSAIENGTFLIIYNGHGLRKWQKDWVDPSYEIKLEPSGWSDPAFSEDDVKALGKSTLVPIVWSCTCETGWFDNETDESLYAYYDYDPYFEISYIIAQFYTSIQDECLCEEFIRHPNGGAVGVIGSTRNSFSGIDDRLIWGWMDAIWPDFIESHGGSYNCLEEPIHIYEMGRVLECGKKYMMTRLKEDPNWPYEFKKTSIDEYHWFGDPSMEIWTCIPEQMKVEVTPGDLVKGQAVDVEVTVKQNDTNLVGATVTISREDSPDDYWIGKTDISGYIKLTVKASELGDYDLVVTAHNCIPYHQMIYSVDCAQPVITGQPSGPNDMLCEGSSHTLEVDANGISLSYQWQQSPGDEWIDIPDANTASYTVTVSGTYRCMVYNECGEVFSNEVILTFNTGPSIEQQPSDTIVDVDSDAVFTITAIGSKPLHYQWKKNGSVVGEDSNELILPNVQSEDNNAKITCEITNNCGNVISRTATLTIRYTLTISSTLGGSVIDPNGRDFEGIFSYCHGNIVDIVAEPDDPNYRFTGWTGTAKVTDPNSPNTTLIVDENCTLQANFTDVVYFEDLNLKASVEAKLGINDPNHTHMLALTTLTCKNKNIKDLTGLESAKNLEFLDLQGNSIANLSPLNGCIKLRILNLDDNSITDILEITSLTKLERLYLNKNPIGDFDAFRYLIKLEVLLLKGCNDTIEDIPQSWIDHLKQLKIVDLRDNEKLHKSDHRIRKLHFEICIPNGGGVLVDD